MNVRILISAMLCFLLIGYGVKLQAEPTESLPVEAGVIRGKVIDAKTREPMQFVNISVRKAGTTVPLKGMVTDETGTFHIAQLPEGSYTLSISFIGYKTIEKPFTLSKQIPGVNFRNLLLQEDSQLLGEVKVTGQRSQMKFDIDKKVFNVDQNISSTGGTASDVLTNIPLSKSITKAKYPYGEAVMSPYGSTAGLPGFRPTTGHKSWNNYRQKVSNGSK